MQYHILFILMTAIIILAPAVPLIVYLRCFCKDAKKKSRKLAVILTVIFTVIAVTPSAILGSIWIGLEIKDSKKYNEMLTYKEELVRYVCDNAETFHTIAEYEASFEYPDCIYYFISGHDNEHLQEELGITIDPTPISQLTINPDTHKVDAVQWIYHSNDYYEIIFLYPIGDYEIAEAYEPVCENIYVMDYKNDHNH